jgi:hypothetical protein
MFFPSTTRIDEIDDHAVIKDLKRGMDPTNRVACKN